MKKTSTYYSPHKYLVAIPPQVQDSILFLASQTGIVTTANSHTPARHTIDSISTHLSTLYHIDTFPRVLIQSVLTLLARYPQDRPDEHMRAALAGKRVYLACPIPLFYSPAYNGAYFAIARSTGLPPYSPRSLYKSNAHWLDAFPTILDDVESAVFIADESNIVGKGCFTEWAFFMDRDIPLFVYRRGALYPLLNMELINEGKSFKQCARLVFDEGSREERV